MTSIRFVHAADFHLDAPFRGGRQGYGTLRRADVRHVFSATISVALSRQADLLLLCGDLFEQDGVTRDTMAFLLREMNRLVHTEVVLLAGNHDPLTTDSWYHSVSWPRHVHLLAQQGESPACLSLPGLGVKIAGYGFSAAVQESPDLSLLPEPAGEDIHILMLHGSPDAPPSARAYQPVTTLQLLQTGYHYVALGHYHQGFVKQGTPVIANPGSPEPLGFDEPGPHGVLVGDMCRDDGGMRIRVEQVPLAAREYVALDLDMTEETGTDGLRYRLADLLHTLSVERHLPQIRLVGTPIEPPDLRALSEWMSESWLLYRLLDDTFPPVGNMDGFQVGSLAGLFCERMARRMEEAEAAGDAECLALLRLARQAGLEALAYGEVHLVPERLGG